MSRIEPRDVERYIAANCARWPPKTVRNHLDGPRRREDDAGLRSLPRRPRRTSSMPRSYDGGAYHEG